MNSGGERPLCTFIYLFCCEWVASTPPLPPPREEQNWNGKQIFAREVRLCLWKKKNKHSKREGELEMERQNDRLLISISFVPALPAISASLSVSPCICHCVCSPTCCYRNSSPTRERKHNCTKNTSQFPFDVCLWLVFVFFCIYFSPHYKWAFDFQPLAGQFIFPRPT